MTADQVIEISDIVELSTLELDGVNGALSISWSNQNTNWGSVLAWGVGGGVAGAYSGGPAGGFVGALAGAGSDYVAQHLKIT